MKPSAADDPIRLAVASLAADISALGELHSSFNAKLGELQVNMSHKEERDEWPKPSEHSDAKLSVVGRTKQDQSQRRLPSILQRRWPAFGAERVQSRPSFRTSSSSQQLGPCELKLLPSVKQMAEFANSDGDLMSNYKINLDDGSSALGIENDDQQGHFMYNPHSAARILWLLCGMIFVLYETVSLPIQLAWDLDGGGIVIILGIAYWFVDMVLGFLTAFYSKGMLVYDKCAMAKNYVKGSFCFDLTLIVSDLLQLLVPTSDLSSGRIVRSLRLVRLLRLLRMIKLNFIIAAIEEVTGADAVGPGLELVLVTLKVFVAIIMVVHLLSCTWFYIGRASLLDNLPNWLEQDPVFLGLSPGEQYLQSAHWTLAQFTPAPVHVRPHNYREQLFNVIVIFIGMLIFGSCISKISASIQQFVKMQSELEERKGAVRRYLRAHSIGTDLTVRVIRFVDYTLRKRRGISLEKSLISDRLFSELCMHERGPLMNRHDLFQFAQDVSTRAFSRICESLVFSTHEEGECVFASQSNATGMHVVKAGTFSLQSGGETGVFSDSRTIAELSLFFSYKYTHTLYSIKFGETFMLTAQDLSRCVQGFPEVAGLIYQYAIGLLSYVKKNHSFQVQDCVPPGISKSVVEGTETYQLLNLTKQDDVNQFCLDASLMNKAPDYKTFQINYGRAAAESLTGKPMLDIFVQMFPELHPGEGTYANFSNDEDYNRTLASLMSATWLLRDVYEEAIADQKTSSALSFEVWRQFQHFIEWTGIDDNPELMHMSFVLVAIKNLGKATKLTRQFPVGSHDPDCAVQHMCTAMAHLVPSVSKLSPSMLDLMVQVLTVHHHFTLGRFLQAQNSPFNVAQLRGYLRTLSDSGSILKVFLFTSVCMFCGLASVKPDSVFRSSMLDQSRGLMLMQCISALQGVLHHDSHEVYWNYIIRRAAVFQLQTDSASELALARLACICRVSGVENSRPVVEAWKQLGIRERHFLTEQLLADGIYEPCIMLDFLPLCCTNALANGAIDLLGMLLLVIEVTEMIRVRNYSFIKGAGGQVFVSLLDLASFTASVQNAYIFHGCLENAQLLHIDDDRYTLKLSPQMWLSVYQVQDPDMDASLHKVLSRISQSNRTLENSLDRLRAGPMSSFMLHARVAHEQDMGSVQHEDDVCESMAEELV